MNYLSDIDPSDINPDTGRPYRGYSSPCLEDQRFDPETCGAFDEECPKCGNYIQEAGAPCCDDCARPNPTPAE